MRPAHEERCKVQRSLSPDLLWANVSLPKPRDRGHAWPWGWWLACPCWIPGVRTSLSLWGNSRGAVLASDGLTLSIGWAAWESSGRATSYLVCGVWLFQACWLFASWQEHSLPVPGNEHETTVHPARLLQDFQLSLIIVPLVVLLIGKVIMIFFWKACSISTNPSVFFTDNFKFLHPCQFLILHSLSSSSLGKRAFSRALFLSSLY